MRISELAEKADVSVRTIRYYIEEGLLPQPERKGPQTDYGSEYLVRLKLIQELKKAFLPLAEIKERLDALAEDEIMELLREAARKDELEVRVLSADMSRPYASEAMMYKSPVRRPYSIRDETSVGEVDKEEEAEAAEQSEEDGPQGSVNSAKEYVSRLLADRVPDPERLPPPTMPALPGRPGSQWQRFEVADGLEIHARGPLNRYRQTILQRLLQKIEQEVAQW